MRTILVALATVTLAAGSLSARAEIKSTTKLTVTADGSDSRINEITEEHVLRLSHVFTGRFIGEPIDTPVASMPRYTITFDIQTHEGVKVAAYTVQYCVDASTGEAFVYLPGRGEPPYRRNLSTIIRDGHDGRWHRAAAEWRDALYPHLP